MSQRKIYIGKTYKTKFNTEFTVSKVIKGKTARKRDRNKCKTRRALNEKGESIKITNLID
jgi:hypothetical protein